ncbi:MAG: hypothetical protein GXX84_20585 [Acidobacteria bacterium]|nr:hypothetical protein [Acidobacteriota bacterium]
MHTGLRWGFVFLSGKSDLSEEERLKVVRVAADMYFRGEKERQISIDRYRGLVSTKNEWSALGCFSGQVFRAEIWPEDGGEKGNLSFLISEQTYGTGTTFSMN